MLKYSNNVQERKNARSFKFVVLPLYYSESRVELAFSLGHLVHVIPER
jgi:hypothetical protein